MNKDAKLIWEAYTQHKRLDREVKQMSDQELESWVQKINVPEGADETTKKYVAGELPPQGVRLKITYRVPTDKYSSGGVISGSKSIFDFLRTRVNNYNLEKLLQGEFYIQEIKEDPSFEPHEDAMASYMDTYGTASE